MLKYHLDESVDISSRRVEFIEKSVEWITSRFNVQKGTQIADFGCGPGLYAIRLARRQAAVTGIDFWSNSIDYARNAARAEALSIDYICQNYLEYDSDGRFDLIMMIMCDFCALSPVQRRHIMEKFRTLLRPRGSILFDVYTLNAFNSRDESSIAEVSLLNGFWSPNTYYGFMNTFKYENEKVILDKYSLFEADQSKTVYNWFQYFDVENLKNELADCGLKVEDIYADATGKPYDPQGNEIAVVAKASV